MQAEAWEENAAETPSHCDTFKEAKEVQGTSIQAQWVDNLAKYGAGRAYKGLLDN